MGIGGSAGGEPASASATADGGASPEAALAVGNGEAGADDVGAGAGDTTGGMPGALESSEGGAPEVTVHASEAIAEGDELSPEEQAIQGVTVTRGGDPNRPPDDESDVAALAEGRSEPPGASGDEPR
jgi:hypothetical protein